MVRFSQLIMEQSFIKELDINPLLACTDQVIALDARAVLHEQDTENEDLPQPAIRPYPSRYVKPWHMKDGTPVIIRPIRPEDEPLLIKFHGALSREDLDVLQPGPLSERVVHGRLSRLCFKDYERDIAFVVERRDQQTDERDILAIAQLSKAYRKDDARFSVLVGERFQGFGLGTELLRQSLEFAQAENLDRVVAYVSSDNTAMLHICEKFGFECQRSKEDARIKAIAELSEIDVKDAAG
jgi:acetyltransferase